MIYSIQAESYPTAAAMVEAYAARRARLMGKAPETRRAPCLTLVSPSAVVKAKPTLINAGGRPRKLKPRPDADDHVWVHRLHIMRQREYLSPTDFVRLRCLELRVRFDDLIGPSRQRHLITPRHLVMLETHNRYPHLSLPQLGRVFGGRDHTSLLSAIRKMERLQQ